MQSAEIELKFPVSDAAALQSRLPAFGFKLQTPRTLESNTLFDTVDRSLRERHQILRIRQYGDLCTLTHKRTPDHADDSHYKTRIETETTIAEGPALASIFEQLGYVPAFVYEKFRSEWSFSLESSTAHLVIDETPIGTWAELEGPTTWIDRMIREIGIDPSTCVTDSYGRLFTEWKRQTGAPAEHMTFEQVEAAAATR